MILATAALLAVLQPAPEPVRADRMMFQSPLRYHDTGPGIGAPGHPWVLSDLDADGAVDLACASATGVSLYMNNGEGTFSPIVLRWSSIEGDAFGLVATDWDRDGDEDLFIVRSWGLNYPFKPVLYRNDGNRVFHREALGARFPDIALPAKAVLALDVDADGWEDLLIGMWNYAPMRVFRNNRQGGYVDETAARLPYFDWQVAHMRAADLDGDGAVDVAVACGIGSSSRYLRNQVLWNDGAGRFSISPVPGAALSFNHVAIGDIDNDGDADLSFGRYDGGVELMINHGNRVFTDESQRFLLLPGVYSTYIGDVDGDGDNDYCHGLYVHLWDGNRLVYQPAAVQEIPGPFQVYEIDAVDMDGDGDRDLMVRGAKPWYFKNSFVFVNLQRHTLTDQQAQIGTPLDYELWGEPGQVAVPMVSAAPATIPLPPIGVLGLDPTRLALLPAVRLTGPMARTALPLPRWAWLRGQYVYSQTLLVDPANPFLAPRLTNWIRDEMY